MKKILSLILVLLFIITSCFGCSNTTDDNKDNDDKGTANDTADGEQTEKIVRKQLEEIYSTEFDTINYMETFSGVTYNLIDNIVEQLVGFDEYGQIVGCMAESWEVSEDGLKWTFKLRPNVNWCTHEGEIYAETVAQDYVTSMKYVLTKENASQTCNIVYDVIENAKAYYDGEITDFSQVGIKAVDKYTLEYTLEAPVPYFLTMIGAMCWLPTNEQFLNEQGESFGVSNENLLYNGAYILKTYEPENRRILALNENYWDTENIFIDKITYTYNKEGSTIAPELFLRGELTQAAIPIEIVDEWVNDPEKKEMLIRKPNTTWINYLAFNFDPRYEAEYLPDDWSLAVNNVNFRRSILYGLDKVAAAMTIDKYTPEERVVNTQTPAGFVNYKGKDYTQYEGLKDFSGVEIFDAEKALDYKQKALEELEGKISLPIQIVFPYSTGSIAGTNRAQVMEQQLEKTLGTDYIDILLTPYPATGFRKNAVNSGMFSIVEESWGPDYIDPATYTDVFYPGSSLGNNYGKPFLAKEYIDSDGVSQYAKLVEAGLNERVDVDKRYTLLAKAETFLIENALAIPLFNAGGEMMASYLDPFSGYCKPDGRNMVKFKGKIILDKPLGLDAYEEALAQYNKEKEEIMKNSAN